MALGSKSVNEWLLLVLYSACVSDCKKLGCWGEGKRKKKPRKLGFSNLFIRAATFLNRGEACKLPVRRNHQK